MNRLSHLDSHFNDLDHALLGRQKLIDEKISKFNLEIDELSQQVDYEKMAISDLNSKVAKEVSGASKMQLR